MNVELFRVCRVPKTGKKTGKWPDLGPPQSLASVSPCSNPCFFGFGTSEIGEEKIFLHESDNIWTKI